MIMIIGRIMGLPSPRWNLPPGDRYPSLELVRERHEARGPELQLGTLGESDHRTNTGVQIALTEGFLERGKLGLARAVARRNLIQLPLVAQDTRHARSEEHTSELQSHV